LPKQQSRGQSDEPDYNVDTNNLEKISMKSSVFLNSLEKWIDEVISRDGLTDKLIIQEINENLARSLCANFEHHSFMFKSASNRGEKSTADRHKLMAEIYQSLLK
jgi:hypothetical protein